MNLPSQPNAGIYALLAKLKNHNQQEHTQAMMKPQPMMAHPQMPMTQPAHPFGPKKAF